MQELPKRKPSQPEPSHPSQFKGSGVCWAGRERRALLTSDGLKCSGGEVNVATAARRALCKKGRQGGGEAIRQRSEAAEKSRYGRGCERGGGGRERQTRRVLRSCLAGRHALQARAGRAARAHRAPLTVHNHDQEGFARGARVGAAHAHTLAAGAAKLSRVHGACTPGGRGRETCKSA